MRKLWTAWGLTVLAITSSACSSTLGGDGPDLEPVDEPSVAVTAQNEAQAETPNATDDSESGVPRVVDTIATGLAVPWGLDFLPDGTAIVTERDTTRVLAIPTGAAPREIGKIDAAAPRGEGGLMGVAVSPDFDEDRQLFLYYTTDRDNRIVRATYDGGTLGAPEVILDGIPSGNIHDGGRLAFGPDGNLYASTGETGVGELAQDRGNLGGKILRITRSGEPAPGNPDPTSPIWSWGHRNVQGLAFDDNGTLWASEFGQNAWDELNLVRKDGNYGWPLVEGEGPAEVDGIPVLGPQVVWNTDEASPSGLTYADGTLWLAALRGERLWRIDVSSGRARAPQGFFVGAYGRLRTIEVAPNGDLWMLTSNRDGRGDPSPADDRILVVRR
ncbi:MAG: PQQ-dependent sugar dehydrogenase [Nocardioides sp.]